MITNFVVQFVIYEDIDIYSCIYIGYILKSLWSRRQPEKDHCTFTVVPGTAGHH